MDRVTLDAAVPHRDGSLTVLLCEAINNIDNIGMLFRNAAALAVDRHLGGPGTEAPPSALGRGEPRLGRIDGFAARTRVVIPRRPFLPPPR